MRFAHLSDWHLGRTTGGVSRRSDTEQVFEQALAAVREFKPDLVLHSGDLFDGFRPPVEEMSLAYEMLTRLGEVAPVVIVAGNHDSPALFELFEAILKPARLHFVPTIRPPRAGGILDFPGPGNELARVACMPFLHQNRVVDVLETRPEARTLSYSDRLKAIGESYAKELQRDYHPDRQINLLVAHLFVEGATWSRSERALHVSDSYATRPGSLPPVTYAAFGHIHKPQEVPGGVPGRYAGSLIPLDFGEEGEQKEIVLVEAAPGRAPRIDRVPLSGGRALRTLEGTRAELEARAAEVKDDLLRLVVVTEKPTPGLPEWAAEVFPAATLLDLAERCRAARVELVEGEGHDPAFEDVHQAFRAYLAELGPDHLDGDDLLRLFANLEEESLPEEFAELERALA